MAERKPGRSTKYTRVHYSENKEYYKGKNDRYRASMYEWYYELKSKYSCSECGESRSPTLDFHHKVPGTKLKEVSTLVNNGSKRLVLAEIKKCIVLCSNCHRMHHFNEKKRERLLNIVG